MPRPKKVNKSKEAISNELQQTQELNKRIKNVERQKILAKLAFPFVADLKTVYDAQTALTAVAGFIKFDIDKKTQGLKMSDINFDLSKSKDNEIKIAVEHLVELFRDEPAFEIMNILELMGNKLPQYLAGVHMADPMSSITIDKFIA